MRNRLLHFVALAISITGWQGAAEATLIGDTIFAAEIDPIAAAQFDQPSAVVGAGGPEFTLSFGGDVLYEFDVGADFINVTYVHSPLSLLDVAEFSDLDWQGGSGILIGLTYDLLGGVSNFSASNLSFTNDSLTIDFNGVNFQTGGALRIGLLTEQITAVPEPASIAIFVVGLAGLGFLRRRGASAFGKDLSAPWLRKT